MKRQIADWTLAGLPEDPVARAASMVVIAVVPGAWAAWLAWRALRSCFAA